MYKLKMVLIGSGAVGKTALLNRFVNNDFQENYELTVGVKFLTKKIEVEPKDLATLIIWDIGGQQRFEEIRKDYYTGATGAVIVFDLTRDRTFIEIKNWLKEIREYTKPNIPFALVGNKLDLIESVGEVVDRKEARAFAKKEGGFYMETSAKTGDNVSEAFTTLLYNILESLKP